MRSRVLAAAIVLCLICLAGGVSAQTQINVAVVVNQDFVHTKSAVWFKGCVEKEAPGKLSVVVHHSAVLGSETQVLQQIQLGTTQMAVSTTGPIEAFVPEIKALEMPFVFPSYEAADKVLDGSIGQELAKKFEKSGFVALAFLDNGFRNVTNSKRPVKTPEDLKGLKIRTMEAPTHLAIWRALGANPTPMAWPIFTQLQQGVIDGQENPIAVIHAAKLPEAGQKYLTLTRHVYSALVFVANKALIDGLPAPERKAVSECARSAALQGRHFIRENEAKQLAELKAAGMQVEEKPDLAAFRKATAPVIDSASGDTKKLVEQMQQAVK
ncbi:MAG: DctP family TRAP transporter solute-binding subunit [candidate division NC10 bacterium]|nr:DctP family TRAP transporter solute-binding subunit [candidate division NC10 bacterium]